MGNIGSSGSHGRRGHRSRRSHHQNNNNHQQNPLPPPPPQQPQPGTTTTHYTFAVATPYPNPPPPGYYQYPGSYPPGFYPQPPPPVPLSLPAPYDHHHHWGGGGRYPCVPMVAAPAPYVEHQKAVTIRNYVNLMKDSLRLEADEENPGSFLVSFTFNADFDGSITVIFFAKEGEDCNLTPTKENLPPPVTINFQQGLGQKFRQPSGTGINLSMLEESLLLKGDTDVYPLAVNTEASPPDQNGKQIPGARNAQITLAVFEKEKGEHQVKVLKQIIYVNGVRYELQEIYGIGNSVEGDVDANDPGKECVICLSEPRDTTVIPCRHMCLCSGCAKVLSFQTNRCPICRQPVERLLEIKVNNGGAAD